LVRNDRNEIVKDADGKPVYSDKMANESEQSRIAARRAMKERAMQRAADVGPTIERLQAEGATTLRAIEPLQPDSGSLMAAYLTNSRSIFFDHHGPRRTWLFLI
jgi:hypothetical protein